MILSAVFTKFAKFGNRTLKYLYTQKFARACENSLDENPAK